MPTILCFGHWLLTKRGGVKQDDVSFQYQVCKLLEGWRDNYNGLNITISCTFGDGTIGTACSKYLSARWTAQGMENQTAALEL